MRRAKLDAASAPKNCGCSCQLVVSCTYEDIPILPKSSVKSSPSCQKCPVPLKGARGSGCSAAATVIAAAATVVAATAAPTAAAAAPNDDQQNDDPAAIPAATAAIITTHIGSSYEIEM